MVPQTPPPGEAAAADVADERPDAEVCGGVRTERGGCRELTLALAALQRITLHMLRRHVRPETRPL